MCGVNIDTEVMIFDFSHAYALSGIPVTVVDFMRVSVKCECVMEHVFDEVLREYAASTAD